MSAKRETTLETIYAKQPISIHNLMVDKRTLNWLEKNEYIKVAPITNVVAVTPKGNYYLSSTY